MDERHHLYKNKMNISPGMGELDRIQTTTGCKPQQEKYD